LLANIPFIGPVAFEDHSLLVYVGYLFAPLAWYYIHKTQTRHALRAVGEKPEAADTMGINVYGLRYFYTFVGGVLAGLAGATISLSVSPGWYSSQTTSGQGWIAVGLVIFAQWNPLRAALGAYLFGALRRGYPGLARTAHPLWRD
jgi:general nucleoside transport system permease protein